MIRDYVDWIQPPVYSIVGPIKMRNRMVFLFHFFNHFYTGSRTTADKESIRSDIDEIFWIEMNLNASPVDVLRFDARLAFAHVGLCPPEARV